MSGTAGPTPTNFSILPAVVTQKERPKYGLPGWRRHWRDEHQDRRDSHGRSVCRAQEDFDSDQRDRSGRDDGGARGRGDKKTSGGDGTEGAGCWRRLSGIDRSQIRDGEKVAESAASSALSAARPASITSGSGCGNSK